MGIQLRVFRNALRLSNEPLGVQQLSSAFGHALVDKRNVMHATEQHLSSASKSTELTTPQPPMNISVLNITKETSAGIAIVMFSHLATTERFDNFLFPALETWWNSSETEPLYIVLANRWKSAYQQLCQDRDCSRLYPLWVDCPEGGFGESPCCKQEKGLLALPKSYDWTVFADDDMYFKIGGLRRYFTRFLAINPSDVYLVTAAGVSAKFLGQWGYLGRKGAYKCSDQEEFRYPWGQPVIYSRAALHLIEPGLRAGGLVKQCIEFQVNHDVGNAIFHWMYQIPDYSIKFRMFPRHDVSPEVLGVHGIHRFIEKLNRTVTMKEVHMQVLNRTRNGFKLYMKQRHHRKGFLKTDTFARFGDPSSWNQTWNTMPVRDCMDKEMMQKIGPTS